MDFSSIIAEIAKQGPLAVVLLAMWWRESNRVDKLTEKLHSTQEATITTLEGVKNTLDVIKVEVSK